MGVPAVRERMQRFLGGILTLGERGSVGAPGGWAVMGPTARLGVQVLQALPYNSMPIDSREHPRGTEWSLRQFWGPVQFHSHLKGLLRPCISAYHRYYIQFSSVQSPSHVQLCLLVNHSTPGLPVHHQLPEFT